MMRVIGEDNVDSGAFEDFQKGLLNALAGNVAVDAGFAGDFVDFVDINNPALGGRNIAVGGLDKGEQNVLNVFADVTRLGEGIGVDDSQRDIEEAGEGLSEEGFAGAGGTNHEDIGFLKFNGVAGFAFRLPDTLVVIVNGDGESFFGLVLPDNVLVERGEDFFRFRQAGGVGRAEAASFGIDNLVAKANAVIADIGAVALNKAVDLQIGFAAERAPESAGNATFDQDAALLV